jgi:uncharacterized membrane protein
MQSSEGQARSGPDSAGAGVPGTVPSRPAAPAAGGRILAVDLARSLALLGMVIFHFVRNLEMFGHIPVGTTLGGGWPGFARLVAGSFVFLAGVSLVLAHGQGIRWNAFLRRLSQIAAAAALVTLATWIAMPDAFIFYGILHSITVSSVIGLAFLRPHPAVTLAAAAAVFVLPQVFRSSLFDPPWLIWVGLAERTPRTLDFEPLFPWLAPFLLGVALARIAESAGLWDRLRGPPPGRLAHWAGWPGRHSLAVYLAHQPILLGLLWIAAKLGV